MGDVSEIQQLQWEFWDQTTSCIWLVSESCQVYQSISIRGPAAFKNGAQLQTSLNHTHTWDATYPMVHQYLMAPNVQVYMDQNSTLPNLQKSVVHIRRICQTICQVWGKQILFSSIPGLQLPSELCYLGGFEWSKCYLGPNWKRAPLRTVNVRMDMCTRVWGSQSLPWRAFVPSLLRYIWKCIPTPSFQQCSPPGGHFKAGWCEPWWPCPAGPAVTAGRCLAVERKCQGWEGSDLSLGIQFTSNLRSNSPFFVI